MKHRTKDVKVCARKRAFHSREAAIISLYELRGNLSTYQCDVCHLWHFTSSGTRVPDQKNPYLHMLLGRVRGRLEMMV